MSHASNMFGLRQYLGSTAVSWALVCLMLQSGAFIAPSFAQLQITEVMYNPVNPAAWEWIEVRNTDPNNPLDLNGSYLHSLGLPRLLASAPPHIDSSSPGGTIVAAGETAVLYNADLDGLDPNAGDASFRDAWGGADPNSLVLIAVNAFTTLPNGGGSIGIWPSMGTYQADLINGQQFVGSFNNATVGLDFRQDFPNPSAGSSIYWNGKGEFTSGVNWTASVSGSFGAFESSASSTGSTILNSTDDLGSPGVLPATPAPGGSLLITELMFDPTSAEPDWEWVELYNNSGGTIDFSSTNYVLDDSEGVLASANITQGVVKDDQVAILYNADQLTEQNMIDAWDPGGVGADPNGPGPVFVGVTNFPELDNVDELGLWQNFGDYLLDSPEGLPFRFYDEAIVSLAYGGGSWPSPTDQASIYLTDLSNDPSLVASWTTSDPNDGISFNATQVSTGSIVHAGGEVGSPGNFDPNASANDADFDDSGVVTGYDFLAWQRGVFGGSTHSQGDANQDDKVNGADLAVWESQYLQLTADINGDKVVDGLDFLAWQRGEGNIDLQSWESQYGQQSASSSAIALVPEPSTLSMVMLLLVSLVRRRTRGSMKFSRFSAENGRFACGSRTRKV